MEDKVKKVTGKRAVRRDEASEVPQEVVSKKTTAKKGSRVKEKKEELPKDLKGKTSVIKVDKSGLETERVYLEDDIKDFWNHRPTVKKGKHGDPDLHLVETERGIRWWSSRQVQIAIRRTEEVIVDNRPPTKYTFIKIPKYTELIFEGNVGGKCKGCS